MNSTYLQQALPDRWQQHLYALMLKLRPQGAGDVLPNAGHLAHAALLHWFAQVDPALAAWLHEPNAKRPFTCSSLWFPNEREVALAQRENRRLPILPGQVYWLRLTLLRDELFQTLTTRFFQPVVRTPGDKGPPGLDLPSLRLGGVSFEISGLVALPPEIDGQQSGSVSWAGYTTYERLVEQACALDPASPAAQHIGMQFRSPTAFSDGQVAWGKRMHLFPDPDRVFDRLARVWNEWAPVDLALDAPLIQAYARAWVAVAAHELATRLFHFDRYAQVGFTGQCLYRLMDAGPRATTRKAAHRNAEQTARNDYMNISELPATVGAGLAPAQGLHLLAAFAFYAGVGQKTAMGMGQARLFRPSGTLPDATSSAPAGQHRQQADQAPTAALPARANQQEALHEP
jgi:CRISPR-associated endoribonuclease Cas6